MQQPIVINTLTAQFLYSVPFHYINTGITYCIPFLDILKYDIIPLDFVITGLYSNCSHIDHG